MKTKLLQTKDYLLFIDEGAEIKDYNIVYNYDSDVVWEMHPHGLPTENTKTVKCIAYHPLTKEAKELDLPLLPPFEEVDIEKLALDEITKISKKQFLSLSTLANIGEGFILGYKAAQSKGQYSLEDMLDAFEYGLSKPEFQLTRRLKEDFEKFIQSLSTQQFPSEFIPEYQKDWEETTKMFMESMGDNPEDFKYEETLKTIINSEGKEILVGAYKY